MQGLRENDPIPGFMFSNWYQKYENLSIWHDNPEIPGPLIGRLTEDIALMVNEMKLVYNNQLFRWFFLSLKYKGRYFAKRCPFEIIEKITGFLYDRVYHEINPIYYLSYMSLAYELMKSPTSKARQVLLSNGRLLAEVCFHKEKKVLADFDKEKELHLVI